MDRIRREKQTGHAGRTDGTETDRGQVKRAERVPLMASLRKRPSSTQLTNAFPREQAHNPPKIKGSGKHCIRREVPGSEKTGI